LERHPLTRSGTLVYLVPPYGLVLDDHADRLRKGSGRFLRARGVVPVDELERELSGEPA